MINYRPSWLDSDLDTYRDTVSRFIDKEMAPLDEEARERGNVGHELWLKAGALGLLCSDIPHEYGGSGGDFRHEAIFYDAMARRGLTGMNPSVHTIVAHYLLNHGTEEQKREYLPRLVSGELVGTIAMTEPGAGSDLQSIRTRAEKRADCYVINGSKTFISNGLLAGLVLVVAKTSPAERASGMSIILVETAKASGFRVGRVLDKIGLKAQDTCELFFDEVLVPATNLLGGVEGRGFYQLMSDLPYERTIIGVMAVAAMEGALEATLAFVRDRWAFGMPIAEFQNTKIQTGRVGDDHKGHAQLRRPVRRSIGFRYARCSHGVNGQTLGVRAAGQGHRRVLAAARWLRLHERVPHRTHVCRRARAADLRWNQRNDEGSDLQGALGFREFVLTHELDGRPR